MGGGSWLDGIGLATHFFAIVAIFAAAVIPERPARAGSAVQITYGIIRHLG
jgi:hypothetical protein